MSFIVIALLYKVGKLFCNTIRYIVDILIFLWPWAVMILLTTKNIVVALVIIIVLFYCNDII